MTALVSLAGIAPVHAHTEEARHRPEHRSSGGERVAARRVTEARRSHPFHPAPAREPRGGADQHPGAESHAHAAYQRPIAGPFHVVRYGNGLSGTVERPVRPGFVSRTFVSGGHVLYAHVYQRQVWYHFGRAIAYETFVPAVRYPGVYYAWALTAWPHPLSFAWGWQAQPWYPAYGALFTPYPVYTSPDLWMTDYVLASSMQRAYQAQPATPVSQPTPQEAPAPAPDPAATPFDVPPGDAPSAKQPDAAPQSPPAPQPGYAPPAPAGLPPVVTPQVKAQLDAQIKVQLQDQETAAATPLTLSTDSTPPGLRPNHVFFQVVQPLEVPTGVANHYCLLGPNDYIRRTGAMSNDDWMIPVVVELSRASDCPQGLQTRIGLNDLNAMENEQEAQVLEAMQAASKSMGPNGPPSGPGTSPTLISDGSALPDPGVLDAIRHAQ
ncbi:MAG: hypothetical protein JO173_06665 [Gammaproteobacteria bacterium]|nr:hypothetical protein [Gammaproteobacteria bacterium]